MEFLPSEIARLVLGYLEDEKCDTAYETFLTTSPNLSECLKMREMGKKFRTQVMGLSLRDILHEYSTIYYSVHERLKKVDPETADSLRNSGSLLDKLTFLLNANGSGQTMLFSITLPHGKSPTTSAVAHVRKKFKPSNLDKTKEKKKIRAKSEGEPVSDELNISQITPNDVDATPLCSLPGNNSTSVTQNEDHEGISRTPKRKNTTIRKSRTNSSLSGVMEDSLDFSVLTKVLIENHELHEKLAENINKVICTPENTNTGNNTVTQPQPEPAQVEVTKPDLTATYSASFNNELDHMIKKVVEQTESDPLFENIIFEALVPSTEETSDDCEERRMSTTSTPRKYNNDGSNSSDQEVISKNYRHSRSKSSSSNEHIDDLNKNIEDQNADAIKSIIAVNSKQKELQENIEALLEETNLPLEANIVTETHTVSKQTVTTVKTKTTENISTIQSVTPRIEQSSIVVISQPQQTLVTQPTYVLATTHTPFPIQNQTPQTGFQTLQLTERDIMSMPTVIMCGEDQRYMQNNISTTYIPQRINYNPNPPPLKILPKIPQKEKIAPQLSITLYAGDETSTNEAKMDIKPVGNNLQVTISPAIPGKSVPMISTEPKNTEDIPLTTPKVNTPQADTQKPQSLSTPRSAKSHIRALDFSTPSKDGTSTRKANTSPKGVKRNLHKKSPSQKNLRTSLFQNTPTDIPIATRTPTVKLCGEWDNIQGTGLIIGQNSDPTPKPKKKLSSWDEDLRALCSFSEPTKTSSPKKSKKKTPKRKAKKKSLDLNKTEDEVNRIESALSTSLDTSKKEEEKKEETEVKDDKVKDKKSKSKKKVVKKDVKEKELEMKKEDSDVKIVEVPLNTVETPGSLRNMRPRYRKKCNITNPPIMSTQSEQISCKIEDNPNIMTITLGKTDSEDKKSDEEEKLSEDQSNSNESVEIVSVDTVVVIEKSEVVKSPKIQEKLTVEPPHVVIEKLNLEKLEMNTSISKITPTNQRIINEQPITFKSNLTPILETPIKFDSLGHPITPKIFTPFSMTTDTPFSKLLNENIGSVDLSSIATPSFPLTPNFSLNITPGAQDAPYNRPTDYSTSSSYYQPSDTDQNQVIDQVLIEESKNMDKQRDKKVQEHENILPSIEIDRKKFTADYVLHEISLNSPKKAGILDKSKYPEEKLDETEKDVSIDSEKSDSSSSSDSSCSSSDESSDDSLDSTKSETTNSTVIHLPDEQIQSRYSLRTRKTPSKPTVTPMKISLKNNKVVKNEEEEVKTKEISPKIEIKIDKFDKLNEPSTSTGRIAKPRSKVSHTILASLEAKRLRVANVLKNVKKPPPKKQPVRKSTANTKKNKSEDIDKKELDVSKEIEKEDKKEIESAPKKEERRTGTNTEQEIDTATKTIIEMITEKEIELGINNDMEMDTEKDIEITTIKDIKPSSKLETSIKKDSKTKKETETNIGKDIKTSAKKVGAKKESETNSKKETEKFTEKDTEKSTKKETEMITKKEIETCTKKEVETSTVKETEISAIKETETSTEKGTETTKKETETIKKGTETTKKGTETTKKGTETTKKGTETTKKGTETTKKGTETTKKETESTKKGTETAKKGIETAKKGTETVKKGIETAKKGTETSKKGTETVKKGTETAKKGTEMAKKGVETVKKGTETTKKGLEMTKKGTDMAKKRVETVKKGTETTKKGPETIKKEPETAKKETETAKKVTEASAEKYIEPSAQKETETPSESTSKSNKNSKTPRKGTSIESVAMKLKQLNGNKDSVPEPKVDDSLKRKRLLSDEDTEEEIPHLQISSDEEEEEPTPANRDNYDATLEETERKKLEELKERGIHLIPKNIVNEPIEKKTPKFQIKNIVVLENDEKFNFSKTSDCIKTDVICKKDIKLTPIPIDIIESEKLDCSMESYQFSLEDDAPLPAEANFEEFCYSENSPCFFKFTHDESSVCDRTLEDYDFNELAQKTISAQVFVSELDKLMTRTMTFSPYIDLYSYSSYRRRVNPVKLDVKKIQTNRQQKIEAKKMEESEAKKTEEKLNKSKTGDDKKKFTKSTKTEKKIGNKISLEQYKNKYKEKKEDEEKGEPEMVDIYSDLPQDLSCKKRKLGSDGSDSGRAEKKSKSDDQRSLLENLDLELFLTTVHGPSEK